MFATNASNGVQRGGNIACVKQLVRVCCHSIDCITDRALLPQDLKRGWVGQGCKALKRDAAGSSSIAWD
jgi:hypothetical protein